MQEFKVGQRVKKKESMCAGLSKISHIENAPSLTISAVISGEYPALIFEEVVNFSFDAAYFELANDEQKVKRFAQGDKVISTRDTPEVPEGFVGYVVEAPKQDNYDYAVSPVAGDCRGVVEYFNEDELELLSAEQTAVPIDQASRDIARPILEERKIGKVQMNLFDEGFPNAVMEVAKVMTWAAENKGYLPHDWKSLPDAETEFSAAASRHKVKSFIQKVEGIAPLQRTDEESNIVHLAHTAFNVLAELELVLTGKIK